MAMGWIGGVIAANHLCSQRYNKFKNNEQSISSYNPIKDFEEIINQLMKDEGCETLQDKRRFLKKLECFNFDFGDKEKNQWFKFASQFLTRDIDFELQKEYDRKHYQSNYFLL